MLEVLRDLIDKSEVISFDIFDTLVCRKVEEPESVFDIIGNIISDFDFRTKREKAQQIAFQKMHEKGLKEITIVDIYENIPNSSDILKLELNIELDLIYINSKILKILNYCLEKNKRVILTSDMYLPESFFKELFLKLNVKGFEKIFVSSEYNATKRDSGELFLKIVEELNIETYKILHIGDNYLSDYQKAKENGLNAFYYDASKNSSQNLDESIIQGVIKYILNKSLDKNIFYKFGLEYGSICFYLYYEWLKECILKNKYDKVFFIARDGYLLNEFWKNDDILYSSNYVFGSRVLFKMAEINENNFDANIDFFISGAEYLSVGEYFLRIGIDAPNKEILQLVGFNDKSYIVNTENDRSNVIKLFYKMKNIILKKAFSIRRNFFKYLVSLGITDNMRIGIVDVGWNGTTQEYLEPLLKDFFDNLSIDGYYFALLDNPLTEKRREKYSMFSCLKDRQLLHEVDINRVLIELLFSAPHNTIISIDDNLNPIYDFPRGKISDYESIVSHINNGIKDFINEIQILNQKYNLKLNQQNIHMKLLDLIENPNIDYVRKIGNLCNFDAWASTVNYNRYFALENDTKIINELDVIDSWQSGYKILNQENDE
ncbi:HAD-IA family hydrolase [Aliarcobacter butzleri]|uniref:HAD-IA family hydrolase n=1 Tax=Aliarcobacter butzleri TaxID=28197 RepID=UPI00126104B3|nr:HAD-IA family hydrolase [Aliarcobacter butzleri]